MSAGKQPLSTPEAFLLGGIAACGAVTVSNPAEVAKTRLQLQGELAKDGGKKVYRNTFDVLAKTARNEGIRGVQRGLGPAYAYQILVNGARLGFYEPMRRGLNRAANLSPSEQNMATSVIAGASTGAIGATLGNPMFLIKARMQAYSPALPVGTQHYYRNSIHALSSIIREEGLRGLLRGTSAAVLRTASGSSVQVPSYVWAKGQFVKHGILPADSFWTFLASSSVSGLVALAAMQPTDTVLTRMYNQPVKVLPNGKHVGVLYKNPIDALIKIAKTEGPLGWYKGSFAHFLRFTPHTIMTLTFNDLITGLYLRSR
ncbi:oxaloacetate carrier [Moniliophthora roreri MCA 2997]|uniref:Oxaloacetate carrier n=2 Tax=Moniliophthora roreri TaxID=221103 RepID=V2YFL0_MONRO|nr:oxaloacetate carrier [Moniliophthora roreri MCA 2997]